MVAANMAALPGTRDRHSLYQLQRTAYILQLRGRSRRPARGSAAEIYNAPAPVATASTARATPRRSALLGLTKRMASQQIAQMIAMDREDARI